MRKFVAILLIALLGFASMAIATGTETQSETETELPEASEEPWHKEAEVEEHRGLVVQVGANGAHIRSNGADSRLYIDVQSVSGGDLQVRVKFASKGGKGEDDDGTDNLEDSKKRSGPGSGSDATPESSADQSGSNSGKGNHEKIYKESVQFRLRLIGLDEFSNVDGSAGLGENDTILSSAKWSEGNTTFTTTYPGTNTLTATNTHPSGLVQRVIFKFDSQPFSDGQGGLLPPTALKFDYEFEGFAFTNADSNVALEVRLQGPPAGWNISEAQTVSNKWAELAVPTGGSAFFGWTSDLTAPAGGSVVSTRFSRFSYSDDNNGWSSARAFFTFLGANGANHPASVVWDPSVVVSSATSVVVSIAALVLALITLLM